MMKETKKKKKSRDVRAHIGAFFRNKKAVTVTAILLAACLLLGTLLALFLPAGAVCYRYGGRAMREEVYRYYFACLKYDYLVRYKSLGITDTEEEWQEVGEDGQTYEAAFKDAIEEELRLRLVASRLFDSLHLSLSADDYADIDALLSNFKTYSYDESPYAELRKTYGIRAKRVVKQVALYEKKYTALLYELFGSDGSGVLATEYREELKLFYEKFYYRYNVIYVKDDNTANNAIIREALSDGTDPAEFERLESAYSDMSVTSGNYPHGIYLYAGGSYTYATSGLDDALIEAARSLDEVGAFTEARSSTDDGTFYVLRYTLDEAPYLLDGEWVKTAFADLPASAAVFVYRRQLLAHFDEIETGKPVAEQTVAAAIACRDYNAVRMLGK